MQGEQRRLIYTICSFKTYLLINNVKPTQSVRRKPLKSFFTCQRFDDSSMIHIRAYIQNIVRLSSAYYRSWVIASVR